jgi:hypothetical protein
VPSEVRVKFALQMVMFDSLLDVWNKWYQEWEAQKFPHITTRFEDLLFHGEEVTRVACECVGGVFAKEFQYVEDSAKKAVGVHTGANGLVKAMLHYGDPTKRLTGFTDRDRIYASKIVDNELMKKYGYPKPTLPGEPPEIAKTEDSEEEEKSGVEEEKNEENGTDDEAKKNEENGTDDEEKKKEDGADDEEKKNEENDTDDEEKKKEDGTDDEEKNDENGNEEEEKQEKEEAEKDEENVDEEEGFDIKVEEGEKESKVDDEADPM